MRRIRRVHDQRVADAMQSNRIRACLRVTASAHAQTAVCAMHWGSIHRVRRGAVHACLATSARVCTSALAPRRASLRSDLGPALPLSQPATADLCPRLALRAACQARCAGMLYAVRHVPSCSRSHLHGPALLGEAPIQLLQRTPTVRRAALHWVVGRACASPGRKAMRSERSVAEEHERRVNGQDGKGKVGAGAASIAFSHRSRTNSRVADSDTRYLKDQCTLARCATSPPTNSAHEIARLANPLWAR
jgi:hypothetical protein